MLHKPNFCSECGEKIEKENRNWWESHKYCDDCARSFDKLPHRILKYFAGAFVFTAIGFLIANSIPQRKPVVSTQNQAASAPQQAANRQIAPTNQAANSQPVIQAMNQTVSAQKSPQNLIQSSPQAAPNFVAETETAYYCGARTQKGTPCSRRMRGGGRCWQHVGKPAMLTAEKLKITQ